MRAFTRLELAVVIAVLAVVVILILPAFRKTRTHASYIRCHSNQKQVTLSFRMYAGDHNDLYPFQDTNSPVYGNEREAWKHFLVLSNELSSPKIIMCPRDYHRQPFVAGCFAASRPWETNDLAQMQNQAVSYFVGLTASEANPETIISGDRNVVIVDNRPDGTVLTVHSNEMLRWDKDIHLNCGNLAFADGSVLAESQRYIPSANVSKAGDQRLLLPLFPLPKMDVEKTK